MTPIVKTGENSIYATDEATLLPVFNLTGTNLKEVYSLSDPRLWNISRNLDKSPLLRIKRPSYVIPDNSERERLADLAEVDRNMERVLNIL